MQIEFDLTNYELENLKRKIDELDPVAQAEKIVEYINQNYTQKQLGKKLGKTRDWIAKRMQFIRALEKLPKLEQSEIKNLVRRRTISIEIVILVADLPKEQRQTIVSKHPTVTQARRMVAEYQPNLSPEAKLEALEGKLSKAYIQCERTLIVVWQWGLSWVHAICKESISPSLSIKIDKLIDEISETNYRFGIRVQFSRHRKLNAEMLNQRLNWLEKPEEERIDTLQQEIICCQILTREMAEEVERQARQVPSLEAMIEALRLQLNMKEITNTMNQNFQMTFGNGVPALELNIEDDKMEKFFRKLVVTFHPDKNPNDKEWSEEITKSINTWRRTVKQQNK